MGATGPQALDSFKHALKDIGQHPVTAFVPAAIVCLPLLAASMVTSMMGGAVFDALVSFAGQIPVLIWLPVLMIHASRDFAAGIDPGVGGLFEKATTWRLLSFAGTFLLTGLLYVLVVVAGMAPFLAVAGGALFAHDFNLFELGAAEGVLIAITLVVGLILAAAGFIILVLRYGLAAQANVLERRSPVSSLRRSNQILRGNRFDFFLLLMLWLVASMVVGFILAGPAQIITFQSLSETSEVPTFFARPELGTLEAAIVAISTYLTSVVSVPVITSAMTNFFLALKAKEVWNEVHPEGSLIPLA